MIDVITATSADAHTERVIQTFRLRREEIVAVDGRFDRRGLHRLQTERGESAPVLPPGSHEHARVAL